MSFLETRFAILDDGKPAQYVNDRTVLLAEKIREEESRLIFAHRKSRENTYVDPKGKIHVIDPEAAELAEECRVQTESVLEGLRAAVAKLEELGSPFMWDLGRELHAARNIEKNATSQSNLAMDRLRQGRKFARLSYPDLVKTPEGAAIMKRYEEATKDAPERLAAAEARYNEVADILNSVGV